MLAVMLGAGLAARAGAPGLDPAGSPFGVELSVPEGARRRGEVFEAGVLLKVRPGNYLYREKVKVSLDGGGGLELVRVEVPAGEIKRTFGPDGEEGDVEVFRHDTRLRVRLRVPRAFGGSEAAAALRVAFQGCAEAGICYRPEEKTFPLRVAVDLAAPPVADAGEPAAEAGDDGVPEGFWRVLFWALIAGLGVSFTPCIYPIIPITAAVVTSQAKGRGWAAHLALTLLFVLGLSIVYALLGLVAGKMGAVLQSAAATAVLAAVFLLLAASLFGAYDLKLPDSIANRLRASAKVTGPASLLVFGAVSGLIVGPCVGGPLGALLTAVAKGGVGPLTGFFALFGFAWGMSALLIAAGTFPGLFSKLPRAGAWMNAVKIGMGLVVLGAGIYFSRTILPRSVFTPAAAAAAGAVGAALLAWTLAHRMRSRLAHLRETLAATFLLLALYQAGGVAFARGAEIPLADRIYPGYLSEDLVAWVRDEAAALARARKEGRPLLVEFYADWCAACNRNRKALFKDPQIADEINGRFVPLLVDGKRKTAEVERLEKKYDGKYPTIVVLDAEGREAARFVGEPEAGAFLEKLRAVR